MLNLGQMIKNLRYKVKSLILRGYIDVATTDEGFYPVMSISYLGKPNVLAERVNPYGLYTNPPIDLQVLKFSVFGHEGNLAGIAYSQNTRFKNLKEGEVLIGNEKTQAYIKLTESGNIEIKTTAIVKLLASTIETDADISLNVNGNVNVNSGTGTVNIEASHINLGVGGNDIARRGDAVQVNTGTGIGTITGGGVNTSI